MAKSEEERLKEAKAYLDAEEKRKKKSKKKRKKRNTRLLFSGSGAQKARGFGKLLGL